MLAILLGQCKRSQLSSFRRLHVTMSTTGAVQDETDERDPEGCLNLGLWEVCVETDGIDGAGFRQAMIQDDEVVQQGPDDQSSTSEGLHHAQHYLSHEAAIHTTDSKAEEVDDCKCNFALRGGSISAEMKFILELLVQFLERRSGFAAAQRFLFKLTCLVGSFTLPLF